MNGSFSEEIWEYSVVDTHPPTKRTYGGSTPPTPNLRGLHLKTPQLVKRNDSSMETSLKGISLEVYIQCDVDAIWNVCQACKRTSGNYPSFLASS